MGAGSGKPPHPVGTRSAVGQPTHPLVLSGLDSAGESPPPRPFSPALGMDLAEGGCWPPPILSAPARGEESGEVVGPSLESFASLGRWRTENKVPPPVDPLESFRLRGVSTLCSGWALARASRCGNTPILLLTHHNLKCRFEACRIRDVNGEHNFCGWLFPVLFLFLMKNPFPEFPRQLCS